MDDEAKSRFSELDKSISDIRTELAESRPIGEIVKYLLYFWLTLSVVLGLIGWSQFSDLDAKVEAAVTKQLPEDSQQYKKYNELIRKTESLYKDFENLTEQYKERVEDLKYADIVASNFDIAGQVSTVVLESDIPGSTLDKRWRTKAITTLNQLKEATKEKNFPAEFIFNAAQVARQLQQFQLAADMTQAAFEKNPSPPIRALKLSSQASNSSGSEQINALNELAEMVRQLDVERGPHIVIAEAWNASENSRNYEPLLRSLNDLIENQSDEYVPSYAYAIKAQILLRRSTAGDRENAELALSRGYDLYQRESPQAQWNDAFRREYRSLTRALNQDRSIDVSSADEELNIDQLKSILQLFQGGLEGEIESLE